ncbi:hypothetical protein [Anaerobranca gottschalkii]|uniref:4 TMS phage holin, superfamily IV n=1 Tax=Anaerobranca gottschalkii DSM 13577 TaxID=1120990 RepID=A0A1I0CKP4_9FIRM|nr:hypothetical protein [Anaerobranca gottschalkii]SET19757.1 hypothetical protein SAMN03080614_10782 [Anaerobranca gottschalkii DSM 13577]
MEIKKEMGKKWLLPLVVALLSFVLLFTAVKFVLQREITLQNLIAYLVFSIIVGFIIFLLNRFHLKIALVTTILGLTFGFIEMFRSFIKGMGGWGDLIGILALFMWTIASIVLGLVLQLGYYFYNKTKK